MALCPRPKQFVAKLARQLFLFILRDAFGYVECLFNCLAAHTIHAFESLEVVSRLSIKL